MSQIYDNSNTSTNDKTLTNGNWEDKYIGTSYILDHKADFEPGRTSDFVLRIKFTRDLYDLEGRKVCSAEDATEALALSIRDFTGPSVSVDPISIKTGNGTVQYAGSPTIGTAPISFTDYIGQQTEAILFAWYSMAHNIKNDKIGFKEYYAQDGILYRWAPNGTRQISWELRGCWINEFNLGQYSRSNPDLRQFSTTIYYDKALPWSTPNYSAWKVNSGDYSSKAYSTYTEANYIGTLSKNETNA